MLKELNQLNELAPVDIGRNKQTPRCLEFFRQHSICQLDKISFGKKGPLILSQQSFFISLQHPKRSACQNGPAFLV